MSQVDMQALLEAGMHFGHLTRRWNPKMKPYIYGVRNGIHIIDLSKTTRCLTGALNFLVQAVGDGMDVLFVGTKKQSQDIIREEAERCKMFYINKRWLGGTLTNWKTIKSSIDRLKGLQKRKDDGTFDSLNKKELLMIDRDIRKLLHSLGGIQDMNKPAGIMVIVDPRMEHIALHEANVLKMPVIALADTNCDPDPIQYLVPGNDDALRSIKLFLNEIADKVLEGLQLREAKARRADEERKEKDAEKPEVREVEMTGQKTGTYVGDLNSEKASDEEVSGGQYSAKVEEVSTEKVSEGEAETEVKAEAEVESKEAAGEKAAEEKPTEEKLAEEKPTEEKPAAEVSDKKAE
jgi:small subunit ribosomal protein S2